VKKIAAVCLVLAIAGASFAEKPKFEPYGFVKGDMYYTTAGVSSYGKSSITCASVATGSDTNAVGFTAQHSRFGLKGSMSVDSMSIGGQLEMDFFANAANSSAKPRMRLAYAWVKPIKGLDVRIGQQWDVFAPLNPTTNNTNANGWYYGNQGARRPQIQIRYGMDLGIVKPSVQILAGETTTENELSITQNSTTNVVTVGSWLGEDNKSKMPCIQARLSAGFLKGMEAGIAGIYAAYGRNKDFTTYGLAIDADCPINKYVALKGEFISGTNIKEAGMYTIGGTASVVNDIQTLDYWFNATSKPFKYLNVVAGFGQEIVTSVVAVGAPQRNTSAWGTLIIPVGEAFSLSAEYQYIITQINGLAEDRKAGIIDVAGTVSF
jgi:hypothetical protein